MLAKLSDCFISEKRKAEIRKRHDEYLLSVAHGYATMADWIEQEEDEDYILNNTPDKVQSRLNN